MIDSYEKRVRSVPARLGLKVTAQTNGNGPVTLSDTADDITTTGTVTFSNAVINLGATSGTVTVSFDGGSDGGTITNCARLTGGGTTVSDGTFDFPIVNGIDLQACDTQVIGPHACTPGTPGCGWEAGDVITYPQVSWGNSATAAGALLLARYGAVYASTFGVLRVGIPGVLAMTFTSASAVLAYLPQSGSIGPLTSNLVNPTTSSPGAFGGNTVALKLNVDFSDAGFLMGATGLTFGDLRVCALATTTLNGLTIRQVLAIANTLLAGGSGAVTIAELHPILQQLNASFGGGLVSVFAQDHIVNGTCP